MTLSLTCLAFFLSPDIFLSLFSGNKGGYFNHNDHNSHNSSSELFNRGNRINNNSGVNNTSVLSSLSSLISSAVINNNNYNNNNIYGNYGDGDGGDNLSIYEFEPVYSLIAILGFIIFFSISWGPLPWCVAPEVL